MAMANSAEIIQWTTVQATCQKILLTIKEDCTTLEDAEKYVRDLLDEAQNIIKRKGLA
jgi:hypothetical protein